MSYKIKSFPCNNCTPTINKCERYSHLSDLTLHGRTLFSHGLIAPDPTGRLTQEEVDWLQGNYLTQDQDEPTWHRLYRIGRVDLLRAVNKGTLIWTLLPKPILQ